ncbi:MAG: hypothetical protein E6Q88_14675 [Lysobacteraceae bacterium]|nr:MAG: hypothetical protein E6Q88_14675 [Xanthomonadaceae bacterium]
MKLGFLGAVPLLVAGALILHAQSGVSRVESSKLVLIEQAGMFFDSSREDPPAEAKLYWADATLGMIRRSALSGKGIETLVEGIETPYGVAFDIGAQDLLWTSSGAETVQKLHLASGKVRTLATSFEEPYAIDISTDSEAIYYSAIGNTVYLMHYDIATGQESSVALFEFAEPGPIHGLALDQANNLLYVGDANGRMVHRLDLSNNSAERLIHTDTETIAEPLPGLGEPVMAN